MSWSTITQSDLKTKLSGPEYTALTAAVLSSGQPDPVALVIANVVNEIRGFIAGADFHLGPAETLPSRLLDTALTIVAWRAALRLNIAQMLSDNRKAEYNRAMDLLGKLSDGNFSLEEPSTLDTEVSVDRPTPSFTPKTLQMDRPSEDGI
jgi:hypothetical protein